MPESEKSHILETGKAKNGDYVTLKVKKRITARIPLKKSGRVFGAVDKLMFHDIVSHKLRTSAVWSDN